MQQRTAKQHTVSKSYLKGFSNTDGGIYWYDKNDRRIKPGNIKSATVVINFYSRQLPNGEYDDSIEKKLSIHEDHIRKTIQNIIQDPNCLTDPNIAHNLSDFLSYLPVRTTSFKKKTLELNYKLKRDEDNFIKQGVTFLSSALKSSGIQLSTDELHIMSRSIVDEVWQESQSKNYNLDIMERHRNTWYTIINSRDWHIFTTPFNRSFVVGDNPFCLDDYVDDASSPDRNAYIPLSKNHCFVLGNLGKNIYEEKIMNPAFIREANKGIFKNAERYVISHSKKLLESLVASIRT